MDGTYTIKILAIRVRLRVCDAIVFVRYIRIIVKSGDQALHCY